MAKHGLGKGVDSLFTVNPQKTEVAKGEEGKLVKISLVQPNPEQPRKRFSEEELKELSESIRQYGVIQPLLVKKQGPIYEIIAGERRYRAAKMAGLTEIPVLIRDYDEKRSKEVAIIENIQREDLNAVEEALAYQNLINTYQLSQEELAERLSKKRTTITNSLRLLKLEEEILRYIREGKLKEGHGRALLQFPEGEKRIQLAKECIEKNLSVREIERKAQSLEKGKGKEKKKSLNRQFSSIFKDLENKMGESLQTKVKIIPQNENRGKLEIQYYSKEDLERIFEMVEDKMGVVSKLIENALPLFLILSLVLSLISLIFAIHAEAKYKKLYRQYDYFMRGKDAETLEDYFVELQRHVEKSEDLLEDQREMLKVLHNNNRSAFQKMGMIRYNAYSGLGGNLSFALAILNYDNSGFVLNSVHSNEGGFLYIKDVEKGSTTVELGAEEKLALEEALGYRKKKE